MTLENTCLCQRTLNVLYLDPLESHSDCSETMIVSILDDALMDPPIKGRNLHNPLLSPTSVDRIPKPRLPLKKSKNEV